MTSAAHRSSADVPDRLSRKPEPDDKDSRDLLPASFRWHRPGGAAKEDAVYAAAQLCASPGRQKKMTDARSASDAAPSIAAAGRYEFQIPARRWDFCSGISLT